MKQSIYSQSGIDLKTLKAGDKIYSTEFFYNPDGKTKLVTKEFIFKGLLTKGKLKEELGMEGTPAKLEDPKFPGKQITNDISYGYYCTPKESLDSFYLNMKEIFSLIEASYKEESKKLI